MILSINLNSKPEVKDSVAIFRLQLFKPSEPFITLQAEAIRGFVPFYLGRKRFGASPKGEDFVLEDITSRNLSPSILWNAATRDPSVFLKLLAGARPAIIHAHFGPDAVFALPIARRLKIPLITTFHGFDVTVAAKKFLVSGSPYLMNYVLFRRQLIHHGALFLCISDHIRERVLELGFPEAKTKLHYIGVDTTGIRPAVGTPGNTKILHVARLVEKKGTEYLIRAFSKIRQRHPTAELNIIGEGVLRQKLEALTNTLGLSESVNFLGAQPHNKVLEHLQNSALLVLPSVTAKSGDVEGLGIVLLEAAASGLPVVGTRHGGIPEAVRDGETGLLVPERDDQALADAIDKLLTDEPRRLKMGAAARVYVRQNFDLYNQTAILENFYRQVLQ